MQTKIYTIYSEEANMTFIMEDTYDTDQELLISTEVKGFYYGDPDDEATKIFYGEVKTEFELF